MKLFLLTAGAVLLINVGVATVAVWIALAVENHRRRIAAAKRRANADTEVIPRRPKPPRAANRGAVALPAVRDIPAPAAMRHHIERSPLARREIPPWAQ